MAAPPSGELHLMSGAHNTADLRPTNVPDSRLSSDLAANSDGAGSGVQTTQRRLSAHVYDGIF